MPTSLPEASSAGDGADGEESYGPSFDLPRVNPVGVVEVPREYSSTPRAYPLGLRLLAGALLGFFALVVTISTARSLAAYCLTSQGTDVRHLLPPSSVTDRAADGVAAEEESPVTVADAL